ncbi:Inhibitor of Bruton tyrosine kinase, partial [Pseudolycoriella hygida]
MKIEDNLNKGKSVDGRPAKKDNYIKLNRKDFQNLYDVSILCENNREIKAHKCVLVSRMEYFNWMFNNNWSERSTVNFSSVPIEYMEPIIDFLYSNDIQLIKSLKYSDNYLYNMIIICDQFFINQLRNIYETLLIDRLTIRKCSQMLEFAHEYNCKLLKKCSLEFIVQNMARVLEHRVLEDLSCELLKEVGQLYRKEFRIKKSFYEQSLELENDGQLGDVLLESFVEDFTVDLTYKCDQKASTKVRENKKIRNTTGDRRSYEKEAKDALKNLSIESTDTNQKVTPTNPLSSEAAKIADELHSQINWTKVVEKKNTKKKSSVVSPRLNEVLQKEEKEKENFVSLSKKSSTSPIDIPTTSNYNQVDDLSISLRSNLSFGDFTPMKRMTQKQRKSFPLHSTSIDESSTSEPGVENASVESVWGTNSWNNSFANVIKSPTQKKSITSSVGIPPQTPPTPSNSFFQSPPQASTSFLKKLPKSKSSPGESECFTKILQDERKEREYYEKLKSKSLVLTQVEETAIDELKSFYNVDNVYDESIRVERASHIKPTMNFAVWR